MSIRYAATAAIAALAISSCATLQQIAALRSVEFSIDRLADVRVAGIDASRISSYSDLTLTDAARVGSAIASRELPMTFRVHFRAENPADNPVTARLIRMNWTLLLDDTETVSGLIEQEYQLPPGQPVDIPLSISVDLVDFFERTGPDLFNLALNLVGAGDEPSKVAVRALPTINTALGPISYPQPITIVERRVGSPTPPR